MAAWVVLPPDDQRRPLPKDVPADAKEIKPGDPWPNDNKYRWVIGTLDIPEQIEKRPTRGQPIGMHFDCGDGGEIWVDGALQSRYDNDHPSLVYISDAAEPGKKVQIAVLVYAKVQGGDRFGRADWAIIDPARARDRLKITVDAAALGENVPNGLVGLSQGGGMADYNDDTAKKLREGGFKWFRMDNVLTSSVKKGDDGKLVYDFSEMDKRVDFMHAIGAEPILAASYMPQVFDAVPNGERQSAPQDYAAWEELLARASKHCVERGKPVTYWEVWNETNAGWLKPGPNDTGGEQFVALWKEATGKQPTDGDKDVIRRLEAYCKLYRATARGVLRGNPKAKIGGPALASGPFDQGESGPGVHGRTFAKGLMLYCEREKLPLDFLSWHEYFQPSDVIAAQARRFREFASQVPSLRDRNLPLMITEWNQAWWTDRPHDHEVGAAWCADGIIRAFIAERIQYPCLFYAKQGDNDFRGDFSILMGGNKPKATYNAAKVFNGLSGKWAKVAGTDGEISCVAAYDEARKTLRVIAVNFQPRYGMRRHAQLRVSGLPQALRGGTWKEWIIDVTHSNAWHNPDKAELEQAGGGKTDDSGTVQFERTLAPNSVTVFDIVAP
jgi:hypothetical protein